MSPVKQLLEILPAGTAGVLGARFALRHSGNWTAAKDGVMEPGLMQALAVYLGAVLTGELIGGVFRSPSKGLYAKVAGLAFGGDLFLRQRFLRTQTWYRDNLSLAGYDEDEADDEEDSTEYYDEGLVNGFQNESALGETFTDSDGVTWAAGPDGDWVPLSGLGLDTSKLVAGPDGTLYQLDGMSGFGALDSGPGAGARLAGFQAESALGVAAARPNTASSFGYSP